MTLNMFHSFTVDKFVVWVCACVWEQKTMATEAMDIDGGPIGTLCAYFDTVSWLNCSRSEILSLTWGKVGVF